MRRDRRATWPLFGAASGKTHHTAGKGGTSRKSCFLLFLLTSFCTLYVSVWRYYTARVDYAQVTGSPISVSGTRLLGGLADTRTSASAAPIYLLPAVLPTSTAAPKEPVLEAGGGKSVGGPAPPALALEDPPMSSAERREAFLEIGSRNGETKNALPASAGEPRIAPKNVWQRGAPHITPAASLDYKDLIPLVTIVTPVHNVPAPHLLETAKTVLSQVRTPRFPRVFLR